MTDSAPPNLGVSGDRNPRERGSRPLNTDCLVVNSRLVSSIDTMAPSQKHRLTHSRIFEEPTRSDVRWTDIESLLKALGAEFREGRGTRVRVVLGGVKAVFHRPRARPDTDRGALKSVRRFLISAGFEPKE